MGLPDDGTVFELIRKSQDGDENAKSILVENNVRLVWSIVKRFSGRGAEDEDLFQIGCMGLVKAILKFDLSYDVKFSTYAVPLIMGEIKRFLRDDGLIKVSRSLKETNAKIYKMRACLNKSLGREPTLKEISDALSISNEEMIIAMESGCAPESLDHEIYSNDGSKMTLLDRVDSGKQSSGEGDIVDRIVLKDIISNLPDREKQIIFLRYYKEKTQTQIAKIMGISQVHVSRIEKKVLGELREKIV